jgi:hypothetical protein
LMRLLRLLQLPPMMLLPLTSHLLLLLLRLQLLPVPLLLPLLSSPLLPPAL